MLIALISDTHCQHPVLPEADLLVHAGDLTGSGSVKSFELELDWLERIRPQFPLGIVFTPGNHDKALDYDFIENEILTWSGYPGHKSDRNHPQRTRLLERFKDIGVTVLIDEGIEIEGVKIWGSPYTPPFCDWAFMQSESELGQTYLKVPDDTQLLITHGPPKYILDRCPDGNVGSTALVDLVRRLPQLKAHVFGHIHEGSGFQEMWGKLFINASVLDGRYRGFNPIHVLDTETWQVTV